MTREEFLEEAQGSYKKAWSILSEEVQRLMLVYRANLKLYTEIKFRLSGPPPGRTPRVK